MSVSALLKSRVRRPSYLQKVCKAEDLIHHFPNGTYIGWSGFTGVGYPKYVPLCSIDISGAPRSPGSSPHERISLLRKTFV